MDEVKPLEQAIEQLYRVFSRYPARWNMPHCHHCVGDRHIQLLLHAPLERLSLKELELYLWKAMTTWGDVSDFKHFLPRILELLAEGGDWSPNHEVGAKLEYAELPTWPGEEVAAVVDFFKSWWAGVLSQAPAELDLEGFADDRAQESLDCIGRGMQDVRPFLEMWRQNNSLPALRNLCHFAYQYHFRRPERNCQGYKQQIVGWLVADATLGTLKRSFFTYAETAFACEFSQAVQAIAALRSAFRSPARC